jgi:hypothetical protein
MTDDATKIDRRTVAARDDGSSGAQMLDRAVHILHLLGDSGSRELRLTDVERKFGLTRPTAHRILKALERHGLVAQRPIRGATDLAWNSPFSALPCRPCRPICGSSVSKG